MLARFVVLRTLSRTKTHSFTRKVMLLKCLNMHADCSERKQHCKSEGQMFKGNVLNLPAFQGPVVRSPFSLNGG